MPVDFTKLPIGTKIETAWGPGRIALINGNYPYPVAVALDNVDPDPNHPKTYTAEGKYLDDHTRPSLFLAPFEWPTQEQPEPPLPDLPADAPIMVRNSELADWQRRHFARWKDGYATTFQSGWTSFTSYGTLSWQEWRLPTEEELKGLIDVE
jgi:hypothetical protein